MRKRSSFDSDFSSQEADYHLEPPLEDKLLIKTNQLKQRNLSERRVIDYNYDG
jgi:hypothetical protein